VYTEATFGHKDYSTHAVLMFFVYVYINIYTNYIVLHDDDEWFLVSNSKNSPTHVYLQYPDITLRARICIRIQCTTLLLDYNVYIYMYRPETVVMERVWSAKAFDFS
jgi:hypothetical protein